ncbi:MAG: hypothetical protein C5B50_22995 [Verrucomicrobia bacterium]|nr:MAG: hypothetical protein C5B50_22995 [Verrucomicrobiota bacterium]
MTEQELLIDCLRRLNKAEIPYMVTGSMASNFWGIPRTTHDLDFAIQLGPGSVPKLVSAFAEDFFLDEHAVRAAFAPPFQCNAIDKRSGLKVDFWMRANNSFEREMFRRRVEQRISGQVVWLATAEDVILHKLYWDKITPSERQRTDAAGVFAVQNQALDWNYLDLWASELGVTDALQLVREGKIKPKAT